MSVYKSNTLCIYYYKLYTAAWVPCAQNFVGVDDSQQTSPLLECQIGEIKKFWIHCHRRDFKSLNLTILLHNWLWRARCAAIIGGPRVQNVDSGLVLRADAARWRPFPLSIIRLQRPPDVNNMHLSRSNHRSMIQPAVFSTVTLAILYWTYRW